MSRAKNQKSAVVWVAQAGLMLALLVVVQLLSFALPKAPLVSQLITGSLVNLVLIVGAGVAGFSGTAVAAVLSPVLALIFGQMPFPQMVPVVAVGNLVIVALAFAFFSRDERFKGGVRVLFGAAGIAVGAVAKTAFLWGATVLFVLPVFFAAKTPVAQKLSLMFSWPQLVTAVIGGILALVVMPPLRTFRRHRD